MRKIHRLYMIDSGHLFFMHADVCVDGYIHAASLVVEDCWDGTWQTTHIFCGDIVGFYQMILMRRGEFIEEFTTEH